MSAQYQLPYQIQKATDDIKRILDETREPKFFATATNKEHTYDDKYALAEYVVNVGLATLWNAFDVGLNLNERKLQKLLEISNNGQKSITLRFTAHETCNFLRRKEVELDDGGVKVQTSHKKLGHGGFTKTKETKVVATAIDHYWKLSTSYKIIAYVGSIHQNGSDASSSNIVILTEGQYGGEVIQRGTKQSPRPEQSDIAPIDVSITHLFKLLDITSLKKDEDHEKKESGPNSSSSLYNCHFMIDRDESKTCRTPWNNKDVNDVLDKIIKPLQSWVARVFLYFDKYTKSLPHPPTSDVRPLAKLQTEMTKFKQQIFIPIFPFFNDSSTEGNKQSKELESTMDESTDDENESGVQDAFLARVSKKSRFYKSGAPIFSADDTTLMLNEHRQTLTKVKDTLTSEECGSIVNTLNGKDIFVGCVVMKHLETVAGYIYNSVYCIECALEDQLIQAIGKRIDSSDFDEYMIYHNRRLLKSQYAPKPFCYSIRRPNHYPEGTLSILKTNGSSNAFGSFRNQKGDGNDKVYETLSRKIEGATDIPMNLPINAATTVQVNGDRYIHAILTHEFDHLKRQQEGQLETSNVQLVARARQFSSFMMVLGNISGPNTFDPTDAIILQNKDELIIPLLLEQMPSAKEFKDAISSMSPEQQRFAKSFRQKQLSSSIFGIMIIQLKPQLELLLNLPKNSLTKEVKLTQSLLELFIEYQIPSDLLTFDPASASEENDGVLINATSSGDDGGIGRSRATSFSVTEKISAVKRYVKNVEDMIKESKTKIIDDETKRAEMRHAANFSVDAYGGSTSFAPAQLNRYAAAPSYGSPPSPCASSSPMMYAKRSVGLRAAAPTQMQQQQQQQRAITSMAPPQQQSASFAMKSSAAGDVLRCMNDSDDWEMEEEEEEIADALDTTFNEEDIEPTVNETTMPRKEDLIDSKPSTSTMLDVSLLPQLLDTEFERLEDECASLRPTKIKTGPTWNKKFYKNILAKEEKKSVGTDERRDYKNKAFDLLDALSRSGSLSIPYGELHVMVAATHCFDRTLIDTVIHDNCNPIEPFERSVLVVTSVLHGNSNNDGTNNTSKHQNKDIADLISSPSITKRIMSQSPKLISDTTSNASSNVVTSST